MKYTAQIRLFLICMIWGLYGCQTISQNFPTILLPESLVSSCPTDNYQDINAFTFTDDFFLSPDYLPERRLCSVLPEERGTEMVAQLVAQDEYAAEQCAFPLVRNRHVDRYIKYYSDTVHHDFAASLEKAAVYVPYITRVFEKENIPKELAYLALIESDFNVTAYSKNNAAGMWQFMRITAQRCGLRVDRWIDERLDFEKSTQAAACHLKQLYEEFGSWYLAAAAYNAGEITVKNAIGKNGSRNFWHINKLKHLKCETVNFVPQLIAVITIAKNPRAYGFTSLQHRSPFAYDNVTFSQPTDLKLIANYSAATLSEIRQLNPALKKDSTPPQYPGFQLHLPPGTRERFLEARAETASSKRTAVAHHTIQRGETLRQIAQKYRTSPKALLAANGIKNPQSIKAGETIVIADAADYIKHAEHIQEQSTEDPLLKKGVAAMEAVYRVKTGDTLWSIARSYNFRPEHLQRWNNLTGSMLHPGTELKIYSQQIK